MSDPTTRATAAFGGPDAGLPLDADGKWHGVIDDPGLVTEPATAADRNRRIRLEEAITRALDESRAEGYGDCPHGGEGEPCSWCDAHWTADALIKGDWIVGGKP